VLRKLNLGVLYVRDASLCNAGLIALTARSIGATVLTANVADFAAIQQVEPFAFELP